MSLEVLNTLAAVGTFLVIAATAIAALIQLRHLRWNNQLQAVLALRSERNADLDEAFHFISSELSERLQDPKYRAELESAVAPSRKEHQELAVADYFEHIGTYVKERLIEEDVYFQIASPARYWNVLAPAIAIYRRRRGPDAFENFEYLAMRAQEWDKAHPGGDYPKGARRLQLDDPYKS